MYKMLLNEDLTVNTEKVFSLFFKDEEALAQLGEAEYALRLVLSNTVIPIEVYEANMHNISHQLIGFLASRKVLTPEQCISLFKDKIIENLVSRTPILLGAFVAHPDLDNALRSELLLELLDLNTDKSITVVSEFVQKHSNLVTIDFLSTCIERGVIELTIDVFCANEEITEEFLEKNAKAVTLESFLQPLAEAKDKAITKKLFTIIANNI